MRRIFVISVNALLGAVSLAIAIRATDAADRRMGIACAALFGGLAAIVAAIVLLDRGPRSAPVPPLRIDADGFKRLDRLDLFVSSGRVAVVAGASLMFFAAAYVTVILDPSPVGWAIACVGVAMGLIAAAGAIVQCTSRAPSISFELDSLTYRMPLRPPSIIRYRDIGAIFVTAVASQRFVCIGASDLDAILASADSRDRRRLARSVTWTGAPWTLPNTTTVNAEDLLALLDRYVREYRLRINR